MPGIVGYLASIASRVNFGIQHSLELEFFKEFIFAVDLSFVTSIVCPIIKGAKTLVTGIRQQEIDAIPKPNRIAPNDGNPPKNAFPALIVLQDIYWVIIFTTDTIKKVTIGNPNHNIILK